MAKLRLVSYLFQRMVDRKVKGRSHYRTARRMLDALMADEQGHQDDKAIPICFGGEFAAPQNPVCARCHVQVLCMHRCAHVGLLEAQWQIGSNAINKVAAQTPWDEDTVRQLQTVCKITGTLAAQDVNRVLAPKTDHQEPMRSWPRRFLKERIRMPVLNYLKPGTKIIREYKGKTHVVQVMDGSYLYQGQHYPTLYTVTMAATGYKDYGRNDVGNTSRRTMSNFSVSKFFGRAIEQALATRC